jgi:aminoglycoside phosphotransferase (APT) family kinase protein
VRGAWARTLRVERPDRRAVPASSVTARHRPAMAATAELAVEVARAFSDQPITSVQSATHGYSNRTYRVKTATGRTMAVQFAVRDPCSAGLQGELLPLLSDRLPVPEVIAYEAEGERFGFPALVMDWAEGEVLADVLPLLSVGDIEALGTQAVELLAHMEEFEAEVPGFLAGPSLHLIGRDRRAAAAVHDHVRERVFRGQSAARLPPDLRRSFWIAVHRSAHVLNDFERDRTLVHADLDPRNILVRRVHHCWRVTALLDWEFSCFGSPLLDIGRLLRVRDRTGAFSRAVTLAFTRRHPDLPESWRLAAWLFDSVALSGLLARPPDQAPPGETRREIAHALSILPTTRL